MRATVMIMILSAVVLTSALSICQADGFVVDHGTWPDTWPEQLESLRGQARSVSGGLLDLTRYDIPFDSREEFEAAWPHLLEVKQPGMPIVLYRGPHHDLGTMSAGVQIQQPLDDSREDAATTKHKQSAEKRLVHTGFLALIVDGDIVDLNRIFLPADTPIIDRRFVPLDAK